MHKYLVRLKHSGTETVQLRTFDHTMLNFYFGIWVGAGFGVDIERVD